MKDFISKLIDDYNDYSELVALNYEQLKEGKCDEATLQYNRGHLAQIGNYLIFFENTEGIHLIWQSGEHTFEYDDVQRQLEYMTVRR